MPRLKPAHTPSELSTFNNRKPTALPHQLNGAAQAARPVMTETARKAAMPAVHSTPNHETKLDRVLKPEQPVHVGLKKTERSPVLGQVTKPAHVTPLRQRVAEGVKRVSPEKPLHAHVIKKAGPAKGPLSAEHNRRLKRDDAIARSTPTRKFSIIGGPAPADIANGLLTPNRGLTTIHTLPFPVGTPQAIREATPEAVRAVESAAASPAPVVVTLPETIVDGSIKNNPLSSQPGEGLGRFAFLGGVVFVAWLMFKGAA